MSTRIAGNSRRQAATVLLGLALIALVAVPAVSAADPSTTPGAGTASGGSAGDGQPGRIRHPLLQATVRADLTIVKRDGTTVLVHYERGEITAVSDTSITIKGRDGKGATFAVTKDTHVRANGHPAKISDLEVGDRAMVFGTSADGTYTAFLIRCIVKAPTTTQ